MVDGVNCVRSMCVHMHVCTYLCGLHGWLSIRSRVFDLIHHAGVQSHQRRHQVQVRGGQEETALMRDEVCVDIYMYVRTYVHVQLGQTEHTASYSHSSGGLKKACTYVRTVLYVNM